MFYIFFLNSYQVNQPKEWECNATARSRCTLFHLLGSNHSLRYKLLHNILVYPWYGVDVRDATASHRSEMSYFLLFALAAVVFRSEELVCGLRIVELHVALSEKQSAPEWRAFIYVGPQRRGENCMLYTLCQPAVILVCCVQITIFTHQELSFTGLGPSVGWSVGGSEKE